jgi:hypothetical protein
LPSGKRGLGAGEVGRSADDAQVDLVLAASGAAGAFARLSASSSDSEERTTHTAGNDKVGTTSVPNIVVLDPVGAQLLLLSSDGLAASSGTGAHQRRDILVRELRHSTRASTLSPARQRRALRVAGHQLGLPLDAGGAQQEARGHRIVRILDADRDPLAVEGRGPEPRSFATSTCSTS